MRSRKVSPVVTAAGVGRRRRGGGAQVPFARHRPGNGPAPPVGGRSYQQAQVRWAEPGKMSTVVSLLKLNIEEEEEEEEVCGEAPKVRGGGGGASYA